MLFFACLYKAFILLKLLKFKTSLRLLGYLLFACVLVDSTMKGQYSGTEQMFGSQKQVILYDCDGILL